MGERYPTVASMIKQLSQFIKDHPQLQLSSEDYEILAISSDASYPVVIAGVEQSVLSNALNTLFEERLLPQHFAVQGAYLSISNSAETHIEAIFENGQTDIVTPIASILELYVPPQVTNVSYFRVLNPLPALSATAQFVAANLADLSVDSNQTLMTNTRSLIWISEREEGLTDPSLIEFVNRASRISEVIIVLQTPSEINNTSLNTAITVLRDLTKHTLQVRGLAIQFDAASSTWRTLLEQMQRLSETYPSKQPKPVAPDNLLSLIQRLKLQVTTATPKGTGTRKPDAQDVNRTRDLIDKMIDDQADDIRQTIKDSFDVEVFQLDKRLQTEKGISRDTVHATFEAWLQHEIERLERRLNRLYEIALDEAGRAIYQKINLRPVITPVTLQTPDFIGNSGEQTVDLSSATGIQRLLVAFGGGTAASVLLRIGGDFTGLMGWTVVIAIGTVAGTVLWLISDPQRSVQPLQPSTSGGAQPQKFEGFSQPTGFETNLQANVERLKDFINQTFDQSLAEASNSVKSPELELLNILETDLRRLS